MVEELPSIVEKLSCYAINDIWNADEFGLFYNMSLISTIGPERLSGTKKVKNRLTLLACGNADGTENFPFMIVGKFKKHHWFNGLSGKKTWL